LDRAQQLINSGVDPKDVDAKEVLSSKINDVTSALGKPTTTRWTGTGEAAEHDNEEVDEMDKKVA
jgi:hypothetical protein